MEIPPIWLIVSGTFFAIAIIAAVALTALIFQVIGMVKRLEPKIEELSNRVQKVGAKVESIADKVDDIAGHARGTAAAVHSKSEGIATAASAIGLLTTRKSGGSMNWISIGATVFGLVRHLIAARRARADQ